MNFRRTAIGIGLALVAVVGLLVYAATRPDETSPVGERLFPGIAGTKADEIDTLEIARTQPAAEKITFTRDARSKRWTCTAPYAIHVDQPTVTAIVNAVLALKPTASAELTNDPATHGLDAPAVTLTIRQGSAKSATLKVGTTTIGGDKAVTFVAAEASGRPLAVKKADLTALFKDSKADGEAWSVVRTLAEFRARRLVGANWPDLQLSAQSIRLKSGAKELKLEADGPGWRFAVPANFGEADPNGDVDVNAQTFTGVKPLLNALSVVAIANPADVIENVPAADLAKYGLKTEEAFRIELADKEGAPDVLYVGKVVDDAVPIKQRYVRTDGDSCVAKVAVDRFDAMLRTVADPTPMRNRDVVAASQFPSIDAIDISVGGSTIKCRRYGNADMQKWFIVGGADDPSEANIAKLDGFLQQITRPRLATGFPAASDDTAFAASNLKTTVTMYRGAMGTTAIPEAGKPVPEPAIATNVTPLTLTFGKTDNATVRVRRTEGSRTAEYLLADSILTFLPKSRLDWLAPAFPTYPSNKVARLTIDRPGGTVDVVKDSKPDPQFPLGKWSFTQPDARKGQTADQPKTDGLLSVLSVLRGQTVVAEAPSDEELTKLGFKPTPRIVASVELVDEPGKRRTVEFGSDTADGNFVHARHGSSKLVYTVPKVDVNRLLNDDLRDATIYRLDRSKLVGVSIRGWGGRIPVPPTHEYAKAGAEWKITAPAGLTLDPQRFAALLGQLEQPRATAFLGPVKPEYKLDPVNGAIEITLKSDGLPTTVVMLGAEIDGGQNYAATVSSLPGEAVAIPATVLRQLVGTPDGVLVKTTVVDPAKKSP